MEIMDGGGDDGRQRWRWAAAVVDEAGWTRRGHLGMHPGTLPPVCTVPTAGSWVHLDGTSGGDGYSTADTSRY